MDYHIFYEKSVAEGKEPGSKIRSEHRGEYTYKSVHTENLALRHELEATKEECEALKTELNTLRKLKSKLMALTEC